MDRRAFIIIVGGGIISTQLAVEAQQVPKVPKIGLLSGASSAGVEVLVDAFKEGMRSLVTSKARRSSWKLATPTTSPKSFRSLHGSWWNERST